MTITKLIHGPLINWNQNDFIKRMRKMILNTYHFLNMKKKYINSSKNFGK